MRCVVLLTALFLQSCIVVPRTETVYDEQCQTYARQMTLTPVQLGYFGSCAGRDCAYLLAALGAVAAASLVVSGSIAVAHNTVYWVEKQGKCTGLL